MNIQEYIASGILETYALGGLSHEESAEVERMASMFPEVKKELEEIQSSLDRYVEQHAVEPSTSARQAILGKINQSEESREKRGGFFSWDLSKEFTEYLAAASIAAAVLSAGASYFFYTKWIKAENKVASMEMQQSVMDRHSNAANTQLQKELEEHQVMLSALMDSSTVKVVLKGKTMSPSSKAMVYWNKEDELVYLSVVRLPLPPENMQYQLWAIQDGKPVDAGMVEMDSFSVHKMNNIRDAQAFAVTLEKKGGSESPDMDAMYLMGKL